MSEIAVLQENLKATLTILNQAIDPKPSLPVLGHVAVVQHATEAEIRKDFENASVHSA